MAFTEILMPIVTLVSAVAAILAWVAKLRWSNEFKEAKNAQIDALKQQLETYKELTSEKLLNHLSKTKEGLEGVISDYERKSLALKKELDTIKSREKKNQDLQKKLQSTKEALEHSIQINESMNKLFNELVRSLFKTKEPSLISAIKNMKSEEEKPIE